MNNLTGQFILLCWVIFSLYWLVTAFAVKRTVETQGWWWRVLTFALGIAAFVLIRNGDTFSTYMGAMLWPRTLASGLVADGITLLGLVIALWARATLGANWSAEVAFKEQHELVERGPYQYVRHPIYSGLVVMFLGTAIEFGRVGGFIMVGVIFIVFWVRTLLEERLLTKHFPDAYPKYKARVKALIPFLY